MKIISVNASENYRIFVGSDILSHLGEFLLQIRNTCKVAMISDDNVWPIYGETVNKSLKQAGYESVHYSFPAGEKSKNISTYLEILNFLAENQVTRSDLIIALGGGVVGDITGFAAATYLRGVSYIQIPTSLLAMVDSSVGGKTAIDLPVGKNLVGAFKQPSLVLCDIDTLRTLPMRFFSDGCAEVIKYGILYDSELVDMLLKDGTTFDRETVIAKCISLKRDVVQEDEFDTGIRQKLNFGHTIGHSIELMSDFLITHGEAVATGMAIVTKAAVMNGLCSQNTYDILTVLLQMFSLPSITEYTADKLFLSMLSDKKRIGNKVNLIVPKQIGQCEIIPIPLDELEIFIKAGL